MNKYQTNLPLPAMGLNYADDSLIADNEAAEGTVNISFKNLMPQTRKGYIKQTLYAHDGEADEISSLAFHYVGGEKRMLVLANGASKTLYQLNEDKSPIKRTLGVVASAKPGYLPQPCALTGGYTYSEKVLVLSGDDLKFFDESIALTTVPAYTPTTDEISAYGTNVLSTTPDEIKKQKWMVNDDNRIWAAGYGNLVRFSHLGVAGPMPDYWPSTQAVKLTEDCTGLTRFMGEVLLFTEHTATMIKGSTPIVTLSNYYENEQLPGGYGCSAAESIAVGDNAVYWANRSGVYRYRYLPSGYSIPECVSEFTLSDGHTRTVQKKLDTITDWTKVWAVFFEHEYRLYIGNKEVLVFDTINSSWALYNYNLGFSCGAVYQDKLFYGGATAVSAKFYVYHMDYPFTPGDATYKGLSDDGVAISFVLKSKYFDFNKAANKKRFIKLYLSLYSEYISYINDIVINIDNADVTYAQAMYNKISRWGNNNPLDDSGEADYVFCFGDPIRAEKTNTNYPIRINHRGKRYNIQYTIVCTGLNYAWALKSSVLLFKMKELK